ncbi:myosin-10-like [Pempheris klunzingeri]|uniref:myosin-10-like n=1 Tax=Pempheris klunzingeri TaxID=3127111 RepID=UPI00398024C2
MQTQMKELQHAIQENTRKLKQVQQQRLRAEEEIIHCTRETEKRVELMMEKSGVVDVLQQLGHLLQEERRLSEQLSDQASAERDPKNDLLERNERVTNKARSLSAEILEVKQCLAEAKARNMAAQALIHAASSKPQRSQSKLK